VIYRPNRPAATRAQGRMQVGCEFFARYLRMLVRFFGHSRPRPPKRRRESTRLAILLIPNYPCSDLDFSGLWDLVFFSLKRAWARATKNRANHLSLRAKTRAHTHAHAWARA
jgi:hypothetical protein